MRHVADEVTPHTLQLVLLSDILDEHKAVVGAKTGELELQAILRARAWLDTQWLLKILLTHVALQRLAGCDIRERLTLLFFKRDIEQIFGRVIAPHQPPV